MHKVPVTTDEMCRFRAGAFSLQILLDPVPALCFPRELENTQALVLVVPCA